MSRNIKIMTHNIWCHYPMSIVPWKQSSQIMLGTKFIERLTTLANYIEVNDYDIICIQELFIWKILGRDSCYGSKNYNYFKDLMEKMGFIYQSEYQKYSDNRAFSQNSGLGIFSKIRLYNIEYQDFYNTSEYSNTKGFISCNFKINKLVYQLINTHLDARNWNSKSEQVNQISNYLDNNYNRNNRLIICGDFNICPQKVYDDGSQYKYLIDNFNRFDMIDSLASNNPEESQYTESETTVDHIFVSKDSILKKIYVNKIKDNSNKYISDHFGITISN